MDWIGIIYYLRKYKRRIYQKLLHLAIQLLLFWQIEKPMQNQYHLLKTLFLIGDCSLIFLAALKFRETKFICMFNRQLCPL